MENQELFKVKGAIYISAKAWNIYQMWRDYKEEETERDLNYAKSISLNALRIWLSYEYWLEDSESAFLKFDHLLDASMGKGIKIVPSLFEGNGPDPTPEQLQDTSIETAVCVASPSREIILDESLWNGPKEFVEAFMKRYANDHRLLAIELFNEPENLGIAEKSIDYDRFFLLRSKCMHFTRQIAALANEMRGDIPLTVGCGPIALNGAYEDLGIDVWQLHHNFPKSEEELKSTLEEAKLLQEVMKKPVWISEWQRIRTNTGWQGEKMLSDMLMPGLATAASLIEDSGIGSFFWSLMLKPAYLPGQRKAKTLNGVFHEDGAVYSLKDARAVSGDKNFTCEERADWPEWIKESHKEYLQ